jgi:outer membrane protein OmpA-like peptidoglycan-associated protein
MCNKCKQDDLALVPELEAVLNNYSSRSNMSYESELGQPTGSSVKKILNTEPIYFINAKGKRKLTNDSKSLPPMVQCSNRIIFDRFNLAEYTIKFHHYALLISVHNSIQAFAGDPNAVIIIEGHADKSGNELRNSGLSMNRAFEALRFLKELSGGKLPIGNIVIGLGSSIPIPGADAARHRRVEIRLCKITQAPNPPNFV